mmetsp:Transcript_41692/g.48132  ORF Transcript_41692/g.48132 Transcript_41692/m.48132 type:complete len:269 (-) Transcript_41692:75-881(-)
MIKYFTASILSGLEYLHGKGIVHRDLKPCNILLDKNDGLKITDFGTAKIFNCESEQVNKALSKRQKREEGRSYSPMKKHSFVGTHEYISPEVLYGQSPTFAIDLWSLGVIVYEMYTGHTPFTGDNEMETYQNICNGTVSKPAKIPVDDWSFIRQLLQVNPQERLGCKNLTNIDYKKIKSHVFFRDVDFDDLSSQRETSPSLTSKLSSYSVVESSQRGFDDDTLVIERYTSQVVSCVLDDEEDDFYSNSFGQEGLQTPEKPFEEKATKE